MAVPVHWEPLIGFEYLRLAVTCQSILERLDEEGRLHRSGPSAASKKFRSQQR